MTHISHDLDRICIGYCPICEECPNDHECVDRRKIRTLILEIMMGENENKD